MLVLASCSAEATNIPYLYKSAGTSQKLDPTRLYHASLGAVGATSADSGVYARGSDFVQNFDCQGQPQPYKYISFGVVSARAQTVRFRFSLDATSVLALSNIRLGAGGQFRDSPPVPLVDTGPVSLRSQEETFFIVRFDFADGSKVGAANVSQAALDDGAGGDPPDIFFTPGPPNLPSPSPDPSYYARIGDAYIGGVARLPGLNGLYRTDLWILNTTASGMRLYLTFVDRSGETTTRNLDLESFRSVSFSDVVRSLFGIDREVAGYVVVHGYASPDKTGIYSSRDDIYARTYIDNGASGTVGVALTTRSAYDYYFCASGPTAQYQLTATGLTRGAYRTNLSLFPIHGETGLAAIKLFGADGNLVAQGSLAVPGFVQVNLYDFLGIAGDRKGDFVVVESPFFTAGYISVIDNVSGSAVTHPLGRGWSKKK